MKGLEKMPQPLQEAVKKYLDEHHGLPEVITNSVTEKSFSNSNETITYNKVYIEDRNLLSVFWYCKSNMPEPWDSDIVHHFCMFADDIQVFVNNASVYSRDEQDSWLPDSIN